MTNFEYSFTVTFAGNLTDEKKTFFEQCVGYSARKNYNGEEPTFDWHSSRRVTVFLDTTKARREGEDFWDNLYDYLVYGSPIRTTNRNGIVPGTRLVNPVKNPPEILSVKGDIEVAKAVPVPVPDVKTYVIQLPGGILTLDLSAVDYDGLKRATNFGNDWYFGNTRIRFSSLPWWSIQEVR